MYYDTHRNEYMTPNRIFNPRRGRWNSPDPLFHALHGNLQDDTNGITQAGNLYMFVMHNPVMWVDPSGLIIELAGTSEEREIILSYLRRITHHELRVDSNGILSIVSRAINSSPLVHGNNLIERLIMSRHTTVIQLKTGGGANSFRVDRQTNGSIEGIGSGGTVFFNPTLTLPGYTILGPNGYAISTYAPRYIILAHELIHANRANRGLRIPVNQRGNTSIPVPRARYSPARLFGSSIRNTTHNFRLEEKATIGIRLYTSSCITENMIRMEHGLPMRLSHLWLR